MKLMLKNPSIKLKEAIDQVDYDLIEKIQKICVEKDGISLKLELDYKLATTVQKANGHQSNDNQEGDKKEINEFLYFEEDELIGYLGICSFGGVEGPLELNGMVHPDYRRMGVFSKLYQLAMSEIKERKTAEILLLCDRQSVSGMRFITSTNAILKHSEYEMYLREDRMSKEEDKVVLPQVTFRKATNQDAGEIAGQDSIYFDEDITELILPEEEEKKGLTIFLLEFEGKVIGKINLQRNDRQGGIYGVGVLPEYRNKGYGRAILNFGIGQLKEWKVSEIMLQVLTDNLNALGLYQSCGFETRFIMDYYGI